MISLGVVGIVSAQAITNTGPYSHNHIVTNVHSNCTISNSNTIALQNSNQQSAHSGNANVTGNTTAGSLNWNGWATLAPSVAQTNSLSYDSWHTGVANWMARHDIGTGWNSTNTNLSWAPTGDSWSSYDPLMWEANGQSFTNWQASTQAYLHTNDPVWLLSWPARDASAGAFGNNGSGSASTGNANNSNNTNFTLNVDNTPSIDTCFPEATVSGHKGGQNRPGVVMPGVQSTTTRPSNTGANSGLLNGAGSTSNTGFGGAVVLPMATRRAGTSSESVPVPSETTTNKSVTPTSKVTPPVINKPTASIHTTGPGSSNIITYKATNNVSVTNINDITISNTNRQYAISGTANSTNNTTAGGSASGNSSNGNSVGAGANLTN